MGELTARNIKAAVDGFRAGDMSTTKEILDNEAVINFLNHSITGYLVKINAMPLDDKENRLIGSLFHVVNDLERIGDHAENIVEYTVDRVENNVPYSVAALGELEYVAEKCESILNDALDIFSRHKAKPGELDDITDREEEIDELTEKLRDSHIQRLTEGLCTPKSGTNFLDLLINLERVSDHAANIAYSVNN